MPSAVVDASVAIKWFVAEADSDLADRLLGERTELHAPLLLMSEVANGLWQNCRRNIIDQKQAEAGLSGMERTIGHWHSTDSMLAEALSLSLRLDHPIYDFLYVMLAERHAMPCVTADLRFLRKIAQTDYAGRVVRLADWRPA